MITHSRSWSAITVLAFAALTLIVLISTHARAAGPWYVAPGGSDGNSCLSAGSPCATINGAIGKASSGDTIYVATGTYTNSTGSEVVLIDKDITLSGGWDATFTTQSGMSTIDGEGARRGITVNSGVVATVERVTVQMAGGDYGRGIRNDGTLTLTNSLIQKNVTGVTNGGNLVINNSALINNGGLETCGGGLLTSGSVTLNNSTVSGNSTSGKYCAPIAGIANSGGTVALNNVTVTNNINGSLWSYPADSATIRNTLIAGNLNDYSPQDCAESERIQSLGYNLIGASVCTITSAMGDQIGTTSEPIDPHLGPLTGSPGYHPLLNGSSAINAGNPGGCMGSAGLLSTDQRGAPRSGRCDIGAYEYTLPGPAANIYASGGTPQSTPPYSTFGTPLQAVVLDSIGTPVNNAIVTFSAPASGASGTFVGSGTFTTTAVTNGNGIVTAPAFTANELTGNYTVTATVNGVITPANFLLNNFGWYVAATGNDTNDCHTPSMPCATINGVLEKVGFIPGDTALVAGGTYTGTGDQVVLLNMSIRLVGNWNNVFTLQDDLTIIDGEGSRKGLNVSEGVTATIEGFTIQHGFAEQGSGITLVGGGIYNGGTLILNDSLVYNNTARYGGGISNGGGVSSASGTLILNNSAVSGNTALYVGAGGGIYNDSGMVTLNNSTVSYNSASSGGGIYNACCNPSGPGHVLNLNNSTVSNNSAGRGGGILNTGTLNLNSSTVSDNTASGYNPFGGGGIDNSYGGTTTLQNTILAGNTAMASVPGPECDGTISSSGYNLIGNTSGCTFNASAGDLLNTNPQMFSGLIGWPGVHPLLPWSPAINAGNPAGCTDNLGNPLNTDQRGIARVGRCDIGAYEYDPNNALRYVFLPLISR